MEHITIETDAFQMLCEKIDQIAEYIIKEKDGNPNNNNEEEIWIDNHDVCQYLSISERTLYRLRIKGLISYSMLSGRYYYTISSIKNALKNHLVKGAEDKMKKLIAHQAEYQRGNKVGRPKSKK